MLKTKMNDQLDTDQPAFATAVNAKLSALAVNALVSDETVANAQYQTSIDITSTSTRVTVQDGTLIIDLTDLQGKQVVLDIDMSVSFPTVDEVALVSSTIGTFLLVCVDFNDNAASYRADLIFLTGTLLAGKNGVFIVPAPTIYLAAVA